MTRQHDHSWTNALRTAVNSPRGVVVATVGGLSALDGVIAGAVAALIAASMLTPTEPMTAAGVALMALEYGVVAGLGGAVLGTAVGFGALRRVPLGKLILCTNVGLAAGLTAGFLGGPWAWHHMGFLGVVGFSAGAAVARALSRGTPVPSSSLPAHSVTAYGAVAPERRDVLRLPTSPADVRPLPDTLVDRVPRGVAPEQ